MNDKNTQSFGQWLRKHRRELDLTQIELARNAGCAQVTIKKIEKGQMRPSKELAMAILRTLGVERGQINDLVQLARGSPRAEAFHPRNNLPAELTSFIGREREITEIHQAIKAHRLVTLTGAGGTGKTRLSLKVASEALEEFPDGVWLVELAALTDGNMLPRSIISALGLYGDKGRSASQVLCEFLHPKKMLLVLDNCEHLIDACAQLVETLLKAAPDLKILTSSRETLGVPGEAIWRVPSLSTPDIVHLPSIDQLPLYESIQLFVERARLAYPRFKMSNINAQAIAQVCCHLDGIPLAIELAAARAGVMTAEQINEHLRHCFDLLCNGFRTALPRQQTLRATIEWSYNLLTAAEQTLLCRCSVFAGGWDLEAADFLCVKGEDHLQETLGLLLRLVDKSLLNVTEMDGCNRFSLLEITRQYALERLIERGELSNMQNQHATYFLRWAETAQPYFNGAREQTYWLRQFEHEYDNLRLALDWFSHAGDFESLGRLSLVLWRFWWEHDYFQEGILWLEKSLAGKNKMSAFVLAGVLSRLAWFLHYQGEYDREAILAAEGLRLSREFDNKQEIVSALCILGLVGRYKANTLDDYEAAQSLFEEALGIARELDSSWWIAVLSMLAGSVATMRGLSGQARILLTDALARFEESNNRLEIAEAKNLLGLLELVDGNLLKAQALYFDTLKVCQELGTKQVRGEALWGLASTLTLQGNFSEARLKFLESLALFREVNDKQSIARCMEGLAAAAVMSGSSERAARLLGSAKSVRDAIGAGIAGRYRDIYERFYSLTRVSLGDALFMAAWSAGITLTLDQSIEFALHSV